nr:glutaredoxin 3 [Aurantiacibacter rhizosphaerae]
MQGNLVSTPKVEIYTKMYCGYCHRAKQLLDSKGVEYEEYDISLGGPKRQEMVDRKPDARTVPQIFIDDKPIGGSDELAALEREGRLDTLLGL